MTTLPNGVYRIHNGDKVANNFPAGGTHPPFITSISFAGISGPYSQWAIKHVAEGAYSITNIGSSFKAYVEREVEGATVNGNSVKGVPFAIQSAGQGEFVIKAVNRDLIWTVREDQPEFFQVFLSASGKGTSQHFRFQFFGPLNE